MAYIFGGLMIALFVLMFWGGDIHLWWATKRLTPPDREVLALARYPTTTINGNSYGEYFTLLIDPDTQIVIHKDSTVNIYKRKRSKYSGDASFDLVTNYQGSWAVKVQVKRMYSKRMHREREEADRAKAIKEAAENKAAREKAIPIVNKIVQDTMHKDITTKAIP